MDKKSRLKKHVLKKIEGAALVEMEEAVDSEETEEMIAEMTAEEVEEVEIETATPVISQAIWQEIVEKVAVEMIAEGEEEVEMIAEGEVEAELATIATKRVTWQENAQKETEETEEEDKLNKWLFMITGKCQHLITNCYSRNVWIFGLKS